MFVSGRHRPAAAPRLFRAVDRHDERPSVTAETSIAEPRRMTMPDRPSTLMRHPQPPNSANARSRTARTDSISSSGDADARPPQQGPRREALRRDLDAEGGCRRQREAHDEHHHGDDPATLDTGAEHERTERDQAEEHEEQERERAAWHGRRGDPHDAFSLRHVHGIPWLQRAPPFGGGRGAARPRRCRRQPRVRRRPVRRSRRCPWHVGDIGEVALEREGSETQYRRQRGHARGERAHQAGSAAPVRTGGSERRDRHQHRQPPEAHTDFIVAVIGEELGFVGVMLMITLFAVLACSVALKSADRRLRWSASLTAWVAQASASGSWFRHSSILAVRPVADQRADLAAGELRRLRHYQRISARLRWSRAWTSRIAV